MPVFQARKYAYGGGQVDGSDGSLCLRTPICDISASLLHFLLTQVTGKSPYFLI